MNLRSRPAFHRFLGHRLEAEDFSREEVWELLESMPPAKSSR
jgi:hypothetical protein